MLRDLIITMLLTMSLAVFFLQDTGSSVLLLLLALSYIVLSGSNNLILQKQLNFIAAWLLRALVAVALAAGTAVLFGASPELMTLVTAALLLSLLPLSIPLAIRGDFARATTQKAQHNMIKIIRSALTANAALASLVIISLLGLLAYNVPLVIALPQLLLISLLLALPLHQLTSDTPHGKTLKVSARNLHTHTLGAAAVKSYAGYGALAALLAYGCYTLFFQLNGHGPRFIDPALPLHKESATVVSLALLLCLFVHIFYERQDHSVKFSFAHFTQHQLLLQAMAFNLLLFVLVTSVPGLRNLFHAAPVDHLGWSVAIVAAAAYAGLRRMHRHTRKHTRAAVIDLHKKTYD